MKVIHKGVKLDVIWSFYVESGEDAIILQKDGEPWLTATVALWAPSPVAAPGYVWLRTWNECEGLPEILADAGLVIMTGQVAQTGFCLAALAALTPKAIAHRDTFMNPDAKAAQVKIRAAVDRPNTKRGHQ
jgi:hypothetical protein